MGLGGLRESRLLTALKERRGKREIVRGAGAGGYKGEGGQSISQSGSKSFVHLRLVNDPLFDRGVLSPVK